MTFYDSRLLLLLRLYDNIYSCAGQNPADSHRKVGYNEGTIQREEGFVMAEPTFRDYFTAAHAPEGLTEREKMFIGLAVTLSRGCEP
jgi:hypothetical protein